MQVTPSIDQERYQQLDGLPGSRHPGRRYILSLCAVFGLSRIAYYFAGIRFDANPVLWFWHNLDPALLRTRLLESIYYQHSQPPFFNLWVGIMIQLFPRHLAFAFQIAYLIIGLLFCISLYLTLKEFGVRSQISFVLVALFFISPSAILYESWLNYTYPVAFLLCLCLFFLVKFVRSQNRRYGVFLFSTMAVLVLTRSVYQPVWYLVTAGILFATHPRMRRSIIICSVFPLFILLLFLIKNFYVFGNLSTSTWLGMGFFRVASHSMSVAEKEQLIREGVLSDIARIRPYSTLPAYQKFVQGVLPTDIPALDQEIKSTGFINYNNSGYLVVSRLYLRDAKSILFNRPEYFLKGLRASSAIFFRSSADFQFSRRNFLQIQRFVHFFDAVFYWKIPDVAGGVCLLILIGGPLLFLFALNDIRGASWADVVMRTALLFICFTLVYAAVVDNSFEISENNRYRYEIDSFLVVLLGFFLERSVRRLPRTFGVKP